MLINLCFLEYAKANIAENFTQPMDYFPLSREARKVQLSSTAPELQDPHVSTLIIGGGGVPRGRDVDRWVTLHEIAAAVSSHMPIVIWGMGINDHGRFDRNYGEILLSLERRRNVLIGMRDFFYARYVPCASCMRPEFDADVTVQHEIGVYVHHSYDIPLCYPTMSNEVQGDPVSYFRRVIQFLGSCETIVTNTYHGAYWATLLNRKVIVVNPFSNKFLGFKHEPVIVQDAARVGYAARFAQRYSNALSESRQANIDFCAQVLEFRNTLAQ